MTFTDTSRDRRRLDSDSRPFPPLRWTFLFVISKVTAGQDPWYLEGSLSSLTPLAISPIRTMMLALHWTENLGGRGRLSPSVRSLLWRIIQLFSGVREQMSRLSQAARRRWTLCRAARQGSTAYRPLLYPRPLQLLCVRRERKLGLRRTESFYFSGRICIL
jgi:hypothetical protein